MIMKKILNYLMSFTFIGIVLFSGSLNLINNENNVILEVNKNKGGDVSKEKKTNINNLAFSKVEYEIANDNTELITGNVSNKGNTIGKPIVRIKNKYNNVFSDLALRVKFESIDIQQSYYISGDVKNGDFFCSGQKIKNLSKNFVIKKDDIYYLHLVNNIGNIYESYLELGLDKWKLSYEINFSQINELANTLNVKLVNYKDKVIFEKASAWLNNYKFVVNEKFAEASNKFSKGFNIKISDLPTEYEAFLENVDYQNNPEQKINLEKLKTIITEISNKYLQNIITKIEVEIDMHGYSLKEILDTEKLPKTKFEIFDYKDGKSFKVWLQNKVDTKLYWWHFRIKTSSITIIFIVLVLVFATIFYLRNKKIYQPLILKEINLTKQDVKYFKKSNLINNVYYFIRLVSRAKTNHIEKKCALNTFIIIKDIFKNNLEDIDFNKYNNIFFTKDKNSFLKGKLFISLFLQCDSLKEFNTKIIQNYPMCLSNKLHRTMLYDVLSFSINKDKNLLIISSENNLSVDIKMKLSKIRTFINNHEWNYCFYDLQNLMHLTIVNFLNWQNKGLNYNSYGKVLKRKLSEILNSENEIEHYLNIVQDINFYRNLLSKVSPSRQNKLMEWEKQSVKEKENIVWKIYFSLIEFINFSNNY